MTWLLLAIAIAAEVTATIALRLSEGFSKPVPTVVMAVGYIASLVLLSMALERGMTIGIAYAVWAAAGVALVALVGAAFLDESLTGMQVGGLALVIAGVAALELGGAH
jgi:small multidrug resistance pump